MIVRNEARDIAEWIAFHAEAGFDTQLIFDNLSTDGTDRIVRNAARHYDIRFHAWENQSARTQLLAYEAACTAYKLEFDWIAFIDSDEYLVTHTGEKINAMLARYDGWSAVAINWAIYGANGHEDFPEGLVTDNFHHPAAAGGRLPQRPLLPYGGRSGRSLLRCGRKLHAVGDCAGGTRRRAARGRAGATRLRDVPHKPLFHPLARALDGQAFPRLCKPMDTPRHVGIRRA
jgi:glycosyltransferase involved in cell wall biosynthesis